MKKLRSLLKSNSSFERDWKWRKWEAEHQGKLPVKSIVNWFVNTWLDLQANIQQAAIFMRNPESKLFGHSVA